LAEAEKRIYFQTLAMWLFSPTFAKNKTAGAVQFSRKNTLLDTPPKSIMSKSHQKMSPKSPAAMFNSCIEDINTKKRLILLCSESEFSGVQCATLEVA